MPLSNSRVHVARSMESLAGAAASVLWPSGCRLCQALLMADRLPISDACLESFQKLPEAIGDRGGQPWTEGERAVGAETRVALPTSLLKRNRARPERHLLHFEERWEAVRGAFVIRRGDRVDNLQILLLDDVMTSGAKLDACTSALCGAGAKSVAGLTIARAVRQGIPVRESF